MTTDGFLKGILLLFLAVSVTGCATVRHPVPVNLVNDVSVSGMRDIRAFSGSPSESFTQDFVGLLEQEEKQDVSFFDLSVPKTYAMLAISGGGANGAYGAGLLNGWSQSGTRPVFKIVTGISTGAIIAPFAFLGSEYDAKLREFYTQYSTKDILSRKVFLRAVFSDSFASSRPLERLIERNFDAGLLQRIAEEHKKGRRLYVGTTNLDTQRLVVWDMGRIACRGDEQALRLFRKIILASSSIPVVFPPVYVRVEAGEVPYDEMHVDGGIARQVFFLYDVIQGFDHAVKGRHLDVSKIRYKIYIIRNGYADAVPKDVRDDLSSIASRALDTMTNSQGVGDMYQLYAFARRGNGEFNLAYIPSEHVQKDKEFFDPVEMRELFDLGFRSARNGYQWKKTPPGFSQE